MAVTKVVLQIFGVLAALTIGAIFVITFSLGFYGIVKDVYYEKVDEKTFGAVRFEEYCSDKIIVARTNYGDKCHRYETSSRINPLMDALSITAKEYGFSAASHMGTLLFLFAVMTCVVGVVIMYKLGISYFFRLIRIASDEHTQDFIYGKTHRHEYEPADMFNICNFDKPKTS